MSKTFPRSLAVHSQWIMTKVHGSIVHVRKRPLKGYPVVTWKRTHLTLEWSNHPLFFPLWLTHTHTGLGAEDTAHYEKTDIKSKTCTNRGKLICQELSFKSHLNFDPKKKKKKTFAWRRLGNTALTCHKTSVDRVLVKMASAGDLETSGMICLSLNTKSTVAPEKLIYRVYVIL